MLSSHMAEDKDGNDRSSRWSRWCSSGEDNNDETGESELRGPRGKQGQASGTQPTADTEQDTLSAPQTDDALESDINFLLKPDPWFDDLLQRLGLCSEPDDMLEDYCRENATEKEKDGFVTCLGCRIRQSDEDSEDMECKEEYTGEVETGSTETNNTESDTNLELTGADHDDHTLCQRPCLSNVNGGLDLMDSAADTSRANLSASTNPSGMDLSPSLSTAMAGEALLRENTEQLSRTLADINLCNTDEESEQPSLHSHSDNELQDCAFGVSIANDASSLIDSADLGCSFRCDALTSPGKGTCDDFLMEEMTLKSLTESIPIDWSGMPGNNSFQPTEDTACQVETLPSSNVHSPLGASNWTEGLPAEQSDAEEQMCERSNTGLQQDDDLSQIPEQSEAAAEDLSKAGELTPVGGDVIERSSPKCGSLSVENGEENVEMDKSARKPDSDRQGKHFCHICGKSFLHLYSQLRHERTQHRRRSKNDSLINNQGTPGQSKRTKRDGNKRRKR